jgi:formate/nitrite transporter FocA (FNT family)
VITLMTWMEHGTESVGARLVAAAATGYLLAIGPLNHAIVVTLEMFAALQTGASFSYADWMGTAAWAALGNMVGGIGLVTLLRLVQIGKEVLDEQAARP